MVNESARICNEEVFCKVIRKLTGNKHWKPSKFELMGGAYKVSVPHPCGLEVIVEASTITLAAQMTLWYLCQSEEGIRAIIEEKLQEEKEKCVFQ